MQIRHNDARNLSAWYQRASGARPHGLSGHRHIIPRHLTQDCRDTASRAYQFSEWGNQAGLITDQGNLIQP